MKNLKIMENQGKIKKEEKSFYRIEILFNIPFIQ